MIQFENAVKRYNELILNELKESDINCWIAGGALRDYFMGRPIKTDYDLFFKDQENYDRAAKHFIDNDANVKWESENGMKVAYKGKTFDLVKMFFDGPQETINEFDFTASMIAVDSEKVYCGETTFMDLAKRQLMINKITYPLSTLSRAFRYHKKGFSICLGEMKKIADSIQDMPKQDSEQFDDDGEISSGEMAAMFIGID